MGDLNKQKAHPRSVRTADKIAQALELRKAGASYREIARQLGCTPRYAFKLVLEGIEDVKAAAQESAHVVRELELKRLDSMHLSLWPDRKNPRTAEALLRISERRAKLLGMDAPTRIEGEMSHRHELDGQELIAKILGAVNGSQE